jgi:cytochrome d ubiquinol oxidase subunit II
MFVALKTDGDIRHRARDLAVRTGAVAALLAVVFLAWTQLKTGTAASAVVFVVAALSLVVALFAAMRGREGWAFVGTFLTIGLAVVGLFVALFPDVMPSTTDPAFSLTTTNAAATAYTLEVMTWVAVVFTPIVLGYQAWTYWVFRRRIAVHHIPAAELAETPAS